MLPLSRYRCPDDPVLLFAGGAVKAGDFFARVHRLAAALPQQPYVVNLCETRHAFMLGFAAALVRGQSTLLPPGRGRSDWEKALAQYPQAYLLSDQPVDAEHVFDVTPFLAGGAASTLQIPAIAGEQQAAILFTSGSTGQPTLHAKTWGQLWRGATNLAATLNWQGFPAAALVGSVPPQHMFGLESTVMLPWYAGVPVHGHQPLFAADLECALADCARPTWWMATPAHLHAPLRTPARLPYLEGVLASTMSLPVALARAAEAAWQVPVIELYGSTETGALATRRTAVEALWNPQAGVSLQCVGHGEEQSVQASGPHIGSPVLLGDRLDIQADGRFSWVGRSSDLIKIGGKRASLSALNLSLAAIAGVDDSVYFSPDVSPADDSHPVHRLVAFYVSATLPPQDVLAALRQRIDPVFMPRPLHRVAHLPRNANGKLSRAALADLLLQCKAAANAADQAGMATRSFVIPASHPAMPGHFPGEPIVPGVVILSQVVQAIGDCFPAAELGALQNARFHRPLKPGEECRIDIRLNADRVHFELGVANADGGKNVIVTSGQWLLGPSHPTEALAP